LCGHCWVFLDGIGEVLSVQLSKLDGELTDVLAIAVQLGDKLGL
jgi:hypothetical protein